MPSQAFTWKLFVREATEAVTYVFGTGAYDINDPGSLKQLMAIFLLVVFVLLGAKWVFTTGDGFGTGSSFSGSSAVGKSLLRFGRAGKSKQRGAARYGRQATGERLCGETLTTPCAPYVLGYWNTRALAEPVRLLLAYSGVPWEDKRYQVGAPAQYDKSEWLAEKESLGLHFPNLPYLIQPSTGLKVTQTRSILRYLSLVHGPQCTSVGHQLRADMVCDFLFDWWETMFKVTYCDFPGEPLSDMTRHQEGQLQCMTGGKRFEKLLDEYVTGRLPSCLARVATALSESSQQGWIAGSDLSYADFVLFELLDTHLLLAPACLCEYPQLQDYRRRFLALPTIAAYRAGASVPAFKSEPLHNRYSHFHTGWQNSGSLLRELDRRDAAPSSRSAGSKVAAGAGEGRSAGGSEMSDAEDKKDR